MEEEHTRLAETKIMIHIKDLWKSYNGHAVLKGLSMDIPEGQTVVILGRSGVGKSVLLRQIIGIEKPDKGTIEIHGESIQTILARKERKATLHKANKSVNITSNLRKTADPLPMGMLFQGAALFDSMSVADNIAFYLRQHEHLSEKEIATRVENALEMVGLRDTQKKMPSELSGGMRKRAALARLIVYRPSIILYDEPTTGLDPMTAMQINKLINQIKHELKATSVVVTHDIRSALDVGDYLAFHNEGKIAHMAPKKEFLKIDDPNIQSFFENAVIKESEIV